MEQQKTIDISQLARLLWERRKTFLKMWVIVFILSCIWILPQPRKYQVSVKLAPESQTSNTMGGLSSLAATFGFSVSGFGNDALYPILYPDIFESTEFLTSLWSIEITTKDSTLHTNYYTYLAKHQKKNLLVVPFIYIKDKIIKKDKISSLKDINPFKLSRFDTDIIKDMKRTIGCSHDKKTDVITITVEDQDPLVCAMLADSVRERLQAFITEYRTHKARIDLDHYQQLSETAHAEYMDVLKRYGAFCDANQDVILKSLDAKRDALEEEMEMKRGIYQTLSSRVEASKAKLLERTPAFTIIQNATVPVKPAKPKRMLFVAAMLILSTIIYSTWLFYKNKGTIMS